jgi:hypothetical protein
MAVSVPPMTSGEPRATSAGLNVFFRRPRESGDPEP